MSELQTLENRFAEWRLGCPSPPHKSDTDAGEQCGASGEDSDERSHPEEQVAPWLQV